MARSKKKTSTKKVGATKKASTRSQKAAADVSAQMNLTDGIALIAELLAAQPHLTEDLGEMAELVTGKLTKKETSASLAKAARPTRARVAKKAGSPSKKMKTTTLKNTKLNTVKLNWKEVWYTNCPLISASNVDQELGWTREEFKKLGVEYAYFRSTRDNDYYPHYIHNLDNLIRFGGLFPPIAVHADIRRTRLLGLTHAPHEGGCMLVRSRDDIYRMDELKGKKIGLSKSLNTIKNDWWRCQEHQGIELMLRMNGMTMDDVEIVEFPYPDDWYNDPKMLDPMINPSDLWLQRDHKHDLAFRPLESALEKGVVDAIYTQSKVFQYLQEATGKFKAIEDLSRYPDWTLQVANIPAAITCSDVMAKKHPELVVAFMKGMIRVGRWGNENKHAAAAILDRQTFYLDAEDTYEGIKHIDLVPNLSPQNLASVEIGKDFLLKHGYIKKDFDVQKWAAPEFLEQAARDLLEDAWKMRTTAKLPKRAAPLARNKRLG
jgi:ABC-type nitrate/sulfonate/bicarbonate transport system substrate-binding protein